MQNVPSRASYEEFGSDSVRSGPTFRCMDHLKASSVANRALCKQPLPGTSLKGNISPNSKPSTLTTTKTTAATTATATTTTMMMAT
eukprot:5512580-Amphidinium_carterae.1